MCVLASSVQTATTDSSRPGDSTWKRRSTSTTEAESESQRGSGCREREHRQGRGEGDRGAAARVLGGRLSRAELGVIVSRASWLCAEHSEQTRGPTGQPGPTLKHHTRRRMVLREVTVLLFALGDVYSFCPNGRRPSSSRSVRRHLVSQLDESDADTVDDTFFVQASQLAAKQRLEELKSGADPIAVALSKSGNTSQQQEESAETEEPQQRVGEEKIPQDPFQLGAWKEIQEMREKANGNSSEDDGGSAPSSDTLVLTRTEDGGTTVKREKVLQSSASDHYQFQKDLLETRLLMEQRSRLRQQNKEIEEKIESQERELQNLVSIEEEVEDGDSDSVVGKSEDLANTSIEEEVDNGDSDSPEVGKSKDLVNTSSPSEEGSAKMSSDGKELFEPTREMLDIKQDNVQMGILVLTNGLMALQSVVDKKK